MKTRTKITAGLAIVALAMTVTGQTRKEFRYRAKATAVCKTAPTHKHDDIVTVTMRVRSWDGCNLRGAIVGEGFKGKGRGRRFKGRTYIVFGGFESTTKLNPRQKIKVTYDRSCGQVMFAVFPRDPGIR